MDRVRVRTTLCQGRLPGFQLRLQRGEVDTAERARELGKIRTTFLQDGLRTHQIPSRVMVQPDGDLGHSLIERFRPTVGGSPDFFERIVGGEIAALIDEIDAVLEIGGQGTIVPYCPGTAIH